ncbi:MAG: hypothetical protein H8E79_02410 [Desulfobulbaceae bacterium]|uniref:NADH:quinone oxidoreductase/Mrp antiporter transmembrane domain-containing protein n=1 Tax=Candidatus Desulfatifera sulfidica TaxID=2841691 RepID=A0A8J6N9H9_9BACT|nr:hypothetical protein [Candidatus Desulfatifera sulfidica]
MMPSGLTLDMYLVILSLVAGVPLVLAASLSLPLSLSPRRILSPFFAWAPLPALLTVWLVPPDVVVEAPWFFMGGRMGLDSSGRVFLTLSAVVWLLAGFSASGQGLLGFLRPRFSAFYLTAMAGNFGLILAQELLGFYLFFALMSFAVYGLVIYDRHPGSRRAGRLYLVMVMLGEIAIFLALLLMSGEVVDLDGLAQSGWQNSLFLLMLFVGFGIKIGALPFHRWMIRVYREIPLPAAVALAGAMVNAGLLGWLRFLPLGQVAIPAAGLVLVTVGGLAALYGVVLGLRETRPAGILAGSSISQLGLMTIIFGVGISSPLAGGEALPVLLFFVVHHGLAKASLFLGLDALTRGRFCSFWWLVLFFIPALVLAGLPLSSGLAAKGALKGLLSALMPSWAGLAPFFLGLSSAATTLLMVHLLVRVREEVMAGRTPGQERRENLFPWPWISGVGLVIFAPWLWSVARSELLYSLALPGIIHGSWPILLGAFSYPVFARLRREQSPTRRQGRFWSELGPSCLTLLAVVRAWTDGLFRRVRRQWWTILRLAAQQLPGRERIFERWLTVGIAYTALCLLLLAVLGGA